MSAPKRPAMAARARSPRATTARAATSASATTMPSASNARVHSVLPDATPPVTATTTSATGSAQSRPGLVGLQDRFAPDQLHPAGAGEVRPEGNGRRVIPAAQAEPQR